MSPENNPAGSRAQLEFQQGLSLHQEGQLTRAREIYEKVLNEFPKHVDALHLLGVIYYQTGNLLGAVDLIGKAIEINPTFAAAYSNLGNALKDLNRMDEALDSYDRALKLQPDYVEAYSNRGIVLKKLNRFDEALDSYDHAIRLRPGYAESYSNRGNVLRQLKRLHEALDSYEHALKLKPEIAEIYVNRGDTLQELMRLEEAVASYERALAINPDHAEAYGNRGIALHKLKRLDEALGSYDSALRLRPEHAETHSNRGFTLAELDRLDEALQGYDRALALKPDLAAAWYNRGLVLQELKRLDEALNSYDRTLKHEPDYAEAHCDRGIVLHELKRIDEALVSYDRALKLKPDYAEAHYNLALCCLLTGDYARGWEEYEWRWRVQKIEKQLGQKRHFTQPLWLGATSLQGKTILLHCEQGLGDTLQFCRYARLVSNLGARVILEIPAPLRALLTTNAGAAELVELGSTLPAFDYYCPLLSLPLAFGTSLETIPYADGYIKTDSAKVAEWRNRLGDTAKPRIGLSWSGSPNYADDSTRNIALDELIKHLPLQYQYYSLQKEVRSEDQAALRSHAEIHHFGENFAETAALCELMDLVISVDTSIAHLTGAMGKPLWVLLPFVPNFRWLLDREDSPWYSRARLFRQKKIGDWTGVLEEVRASLIRHFNERA